MSNVIEIVRGEAECYFNCFTSAIEIALVIILSK